MSRAGFNKGAEDDKAVNSEVEEEEEPPKTVIQDLPNELLAQILNWIEDDLELENAQQVCSRWHHVINECVGRTESRLVYAGNGGKSYPGRLEREVAISSVGIRKLIILALEPSTFPPLRYPHLLKSLRLENSIPPDIFTNLLKDPVRNLNTFRFTLRALKRLRPEDLEHLDKHFPNLRTLIGGHEGFDGFVHSPNLDVLFKENRFLQLASLSINFQLHFVQDLETFRLLLRFIQVHSTSLMELQITVYSERPSYYLVFDDTYPSSLEGVIAQLNREVNKYSNPPTRSLKVMTLTAEAMYLPPGRGNPKLELFQKLLIWPLASLRELDLELDFISNELLQQITLRNGTTLKIVKLKQNTPYPKEPLDLAVFSSLKNPHHPHHLFLCGFQELTGATQLPPSLQLLDIFGGKMRSDDLHHILLHSPNIQNITLYIEDDPGGKEEGFGLRMDTLQQFLMEKRTRKDWVCPLPEGVSKRCFFHWDPTIVEQIKEDAIP